MRFRLRGFHGTNVLIRVKRSSYFLAWQCRRFKFYFLIFVGMVALLQCVRDLGVRAALLDPTFQLPYPIESGTKLKFLIQKKYFFLFFLHIK